MRSRPLALLAVVAVASLTVAAGTAAAPPPEPVCGACDAELEAAVADAGGSVTVTDATLTVRVGDDGAARVAAANRLAPGDTSWVANHTDAVLAELAAGDDGLAPVPRDATVRVHGNYLEVEYDAPGLARSSFGRVVLVGAFRDTRSTAWRVNVDRFVLHAPTGFVFTRVPVGAAGDAFVAHRGDVIDDEFVAFAPDDGAVSNALTRLAVALELGPQFLADAALALAVPVLAVAGLLRGFRAASARLPAPDTAASPGRLVALAGAAVALALVATGHTSSYFEPYWAAPLFTAVTGVLVGGLAAADALDDDRVLAVAAVGTPVALGALAAVAGARFHPEVAYYTVRRALVAGLLAAHAWTFAVAGAHRTRWRWRRQVAVVAAPLVAVVALAGPAWLAGAAAVWLLVAAATPAAYWLGASLRSV
ncbi:MAG: hypothetical protein ABEJ88_10130 [Halobacterium sp.]